VVAALTVLRAFVVAGKPRHDHPPKGSFESWDRLVRGAIIWAGGADPLGGVQRIREQGDDDLDTLRVLLTTWHAKYGGAEKTLAEVIKDAVTDKTLAEKPVAEKTPAESMASSELHDALADYCRSGRPEAKPIGNALRKVQGRIVNGFAFERRAGDRNGVARWRVTVTSSEGSAGSAGSAGSLPRSSERQVGFQGVET